MLLVGSIVIMINNVGNDLSCKNRRRNDLHRVLKNCANLFLAEFCQISINVDNFLQKDGKEAINYARCTHFPRHLIHLITLPC